MLQRLSICSACRHNLNVSVKRTNISRATLKQYATASTQRRPLRLAIIGSGPAGYYSAYRVMKKLPDAFVDMYESLPVPYGLVRFGVAPDHPEVKKSSETLDDVGKWRNFNFIGNVPIGESNKSVLLKTIAAHYDAILFAYGASKDKRFGIPGETLQGVHSARAFVGWYNGLPEYADHTPDLQAGDTAAVLGQGNVALDVTRMLLSPIDELRKTDISEQALEALSKSRVTQVKVIGRRGPLQAPYTIKELRELANIDGVEFLPPTEDWEAHYDIQRKKLPRQLRRIMEVLEKASGAAVQDVRKDWQLLFLRSPIEFLSNSEASTDSSTENLDRIMFEKMRYKESVQQAVQTIIDKQLPEVEQLQGMLNAIRRIGVERNGETDTVHAQLAFRSIGYLSEALEGLDDVGVPFDGKLGIIPNDMHGRVLSPDRGPGGLSAGHVPGMYCAGWVKRGPTGVIASTLDDAFHTADILISDWENEVMFNELVHNSDKVGWEGVRGEVERKGIRRVSWQDWEKIDAEERKRGQAKGRERVKITNVDEMLQILDP